MRIILKKSNVLHILGVVLLVLFSSCLYSQSGDVRKEENHCPGLDFGNCTTVIVNYKDTGSWGFTYIDKIFITAIRRSLSTDYKAKTCVYALYISHDGGGPFNAQRFLKLELAQGDDPSEDLKRSIIRALPSGVSIGSDLPSGWRSNNVFNSKYSRKIVDALVNYDCSWIWSSVKSSED